MLSKWPNLLRSGDFSGKFNVDHLGHTLPELGCLAGHWPSSLQHTGSAVGLRWMVMCRGGLLGGARGTGGN